MLQQTLKELLKFLASPTGAWVLLGAGCIILLAIVYHRKRQIPGITVEPIPDDTWFINRDDNHRLVIVVSLHFINKSGSPIRLEKCKLSGYTPKADPPQLVLEGYDKTVELEYPEYDLFSGQEYIINPYTEQRMWVCYESRMVTMTNRLRAPVVIKDANRKRKSVHLNIPRNMEQILIYRESAMRW